MDPSRLSSAQRRLVNAAAKQWYGPPGAAWAAENKIAAIRAGIDSAETLPAYEKSGGGGALAHAVLSLGPDVCKTIPGLSEIMGALEIAQNIPIIGDLVNAIGGKVLDVVIGGIEDLIGGALDIIEEIPVVGDIAGALETGVEDVGDFLFGWI